jgi:hypothetical protein
MALRKLYGRARRNVRTSLSECRAGFERCARIHRCSIILIAGLSSANWLRLLVSQTQTNHLSVLFPRPPITDCRLLMSDASGHFASFPFHWRVVVAVLKNLHNILHQKIVHA